MWRTCRLHSERPWTSLELNPETSCCEQITAPLSVNSQIRHAISASVHRRLSSVHHTTLLPMDSLLKSLWICHNCCVLRYKGLKKWSNCHNLSKPGRHCTPHLKRSGGLWSHVYYGTKQCWICGTLQRVKHHSSRMRAQMFAVSTVSCNLTCKRLREVKNRRDMAKKEIEK